MTIESFSHLSYEHYYSKQINEHVQEKQIFHLSTTVPMIYLSQRICYNCFLYMYILDDDLRLVNALSWLFLKMFNALPLSSLLTEI